MDDPGRTDLLTDSGTAFGLNDVGGNDVTLANGALVAGQPNSVSLNGGVPGAIATASFIPTGTDSSFFVDPTAQQYLALVIESAFTNTLSVATLTPGPVTGLRIQAGGGDSTFEVPEPATLSIFGAALLGLGFAKRRQKKNKNNA